MHAHTNTCTHTGTHMQTHTCKLIHIMHAQTDKRVTHTHWPNAQKHLLTAHSHTGTHTGRHIHASICTHAYTRKQREKRERDRHTPTPNRPHTHMASIPQDNRGCQTGLGVSLGFTTTRTPTSHSSWGSGRSRLCTGLVFSVLVHTVSTVSGAECISRVDTHKQYHVFIINVVDG